MERKPQSLYKRSFTTPAPKAETKSASPRSATIERSQYPGLMWRKVEKSIATTSINKKSRGHYGTIWRKVRDSKLHTGFQNPPAAISEPTSTQSLVSSLAQENASSSTPSTSLSGASVTPKS